MVSLPGNPMLRCLGPRYPRLIAAACQTFFTGPLLRKRLPVNGGKNEKCSLVPLAFNKLSLACFLTGKNEKKARQAFFSTSKNCIILSPTPRNKSATVTCGFTPMLTTLNFHFTAHFYDSLGP